MKTLSFATCAVLASLTCNVSAKSPTPAPSPSASAAPAKPRTEGKKEKLADKLGLSDEQRTQLKALTSENRPAVKAIRENTSLSKEQKKEQIATLRQAMNEKIKAILTPDQLAKFQEMHTRKKDRQAAPAASPATT